jgi:hypothetical protein
MIRISYALPLAAMAFGGISMTTPAHAQALEDKFWLQVAAYRPDVDTEVNIASTQRPNISTQIDLESDLDLADRDTVPAVYGGWRISKSFQIAGEFYSLSRNGSTGIRRDINFDGVTYPASATLASKFKTEVYRLTVGYTFVRRPTFEIGGALGAHLTNFDLSLAGQGSVGGETASTEVRQKKFLAPLPTLGLFGSFEPVPRLTLGGRIDYLSLTIDEYHGRLINTQATISYRILKNVGIGAMYRYVDYRVDVRKPEWTGRVAYDYKGPALFLEVGF